MPFALKVIANSGEEDWIREGRSGDGEIARFRKRSDAEVTKRNFLEGISDEVQSINVVPYPRRSEAR